MATRRSKKEKGEERHPVVGFVPVRKIPENTLYMQMHGGVATLPDKTEIDLGSTCGLGGVSLLAGCSKGPRDKNDGRSSLARRYHVEGRDLVDAVIRDDAKDGEDPALAMAAALEKILTANHVTEKLLDDVDDDKLSGKRAMSLMNITIADVRAAAKALAAFRGIT